MTPLLGFAPDADLNTPGIFTDCDHVIPYEAGFRGAPTAVAAAVGPLAAECRGAVVATKLDGTRRIFAGTQTKLYELTAGAWADVSVAGSYTGSSESRWSFCQFGDTTVASNLADNMQSAGAGAFTAIAGAPKARIIVSASNNFVLAFHTVDGTYGTSPDRWWCCAQNDQTSWTPAVTTMANTGRLVSVEGAITAALKLGDYVIAYKKKAVYVGSFVGSPVVWQWNVAPGDAGCVGPDAVCDIGGAHFFVGDDNFWVFDGTRPTSVPNAPRQWFLDNSNPTYRYRTQVSFDRHNNLVRVHYPSLGSSTCDATLVYHVLKKQWGRANMTIEATLSYIAPGTTYDTWSAYGATYDSLPSVGYDSQYWLSGGQIPSVFGVTHQLSSINGDTADSSFETSDVGDDDAVTLVERFRVRFESKPTTAEATGYLKMNEGDAFTTGAAANSVNDGKFDLRQSGRFHRMAVEMTGNWKATALDVKLKRVAQAMRLQANPLLPMSEDRKALDRVLFDLIRASNQKVNDLSDGRFAARDLVASSVPTTGSYAKGDFVANSAPAELGVAASKYVVEGWLCLVGGTPGTFVQKRFLTGN